MIYILFIIYLFICSLITNRSVIKFPTNNNYDKIFLFAVFLVAWLIASLRGVEVGVDTHMYFKMFNRHHNAESFFDPVLSRDVEPGWAFLAWFINYIGGDFILFQLIFYGIFCLLAANFVVLGTKHLKLNSVFIITLLFITNIWLLSFNIARQMMAVMFAINAWLYFCDKKHILSIILFLLALSFHYSAFISLFLFILWKYREYKFLGIISIIVFIVGLVEFNILWKIMIDLGFYEKYINNGFNTFQQAGLSRIVWCIITLHALWIILKQSQFTSFDKVVAIGCLIYVFTNIMSTKINYLERLGLYFIPFITLVYPIVGNNIKSIGLRLFYFSSIAILYSIWFILGSMRPQYIYFLGIDL